MVPERNQVPLSKVESQCVTPDWMKHLPGWAFESRGKVWETEEKLGRGQLTGEPSVLWDEVSQEAEAESWSRDFGYSTFR